MTIIGEKENEKRTGEQDLSDTTKAGIEMGTSHSSLKLNEKEKR